MAFLTELGGQMAFMVREAGERVGEIRQGIRYFPGVDGLRAVAVLSVLIFHLYEPSLPGGYVGVDIFFVISGFVVTGSVAHLKAPTLRHFQSYFYARRVVRIMPALVVCLLLTWLARTLFIPPAWLSRLVSLTGLAAFFGVSNFVLAFNSDDYFSPVAAFNPFVHTWSLGVEEQFYLIFPFLIYYFHARTDEAGTRNRAVLIIAMLSAISFLACGVLSYTHSGYAFYLLPARFWELGCGVVLYLSMAKWKRPLAALSPVPTGLALLASFGLLVISLRLPASDLFPFPLGILPVAGTAGLIALVVAQPHALLARPLSARLPVSIGKVSYSLYLWHWPVFVLFRWTIGLEGLWKGAAAAAIAFALAVLSYTIVEKPTRGSKWLQKMPKGRVIAAGLVTVCAATLVSVGLDASGRFFTLSVVAADIETWHPDGRMLRPSTSGCVLNETNIVVAGVPADVWTPTHCLNPGTRRLYVVGDSHARVYAPMLRQLALDSGNEVRLYDPRPCAFIPLNMPISKLEERCRKINQDLVAHMMQDLKHGDVIFLPALRVPRYKTQWGGVATSMDRATQRALGIQSMDRATQYALRNDAVNEAAHVLSAITMHGVHVMFEAPTPIFKTPPFRCSDWFNAGNEVCADGFEIGREELQNLRSSVLESMEILTGRIPGTAIWDPFPILCPDEVCRPFRGNKPLFFDGDHLSGFANQVLYDDFAAYTAQLFVEKAPTRRL
jgi:peptidoglycan/LPS O-acetylase OafA/YrhL